MERGAAQGGSRLIEVSSAGNIVEMLAMIRRRNWLFHMLAALSLVVFLACVFECVRSYWVSDYIVINVNRQFDLDVESNRGSIQLGNETYSDAVFIGHELPPRVQFRATPTTKRPKRVGTVLGSLGFGYDVGAIPGLPKSIGLRRELTIPFYVPVVLSGAILLAWQHWRKQSRFQPGHCVSCGYDLRASRERCPECGTGIDAAPTRDEREQPRA